MRTAPYVLPVYVDSAVAYDKEQSSSCFLALHHFSANKGVPHHTTKYVSRADTSQLISDTGKMNTLNN